LKLIIVAALAVAFIVGGFLFVRWLYLDNFSETSLAAFTDYGQNTKEPSTYSGNIYINMINLTIPAAKVGNESKYGQTMPGFATSAFSKVFNGMSFDMKDPRTYFSFVFTAFSQYDDQGGSLTVAQGNDDKVPSISNFDEVPEGYIYFSEEEEYQADEASKSGALPMEGDSSAAEPDINTVISDPARLEIEKKAPSILLLHTHSMETYSPFADNNYHSTDNKKNVTKVGSIMTDVLESKYKYNVIHDISKHDNPSYADSYINSQRTIISQLEKNPSVKVVLDVHRDAMEAKTEKDKENIKAKYTTIINGKSAAKVEFVIGPDNKNYAELQKFVVYVKKKMDKLYPGLFYNTVVKSKGKYNQFYRDHTLLIEVGCTFNTDAEAKYTAELMGNVIGEVLKELEK
jgi:stage II sporulation protein P